MRAALCISLAYLLGSIPSAYVVARLRGYDIRKLGDSNVGAANVLRCFGIVPAAITLSADIVKGTISVLLARLLGASEAVVLASGIAAIAGHNWPITLGFRGGRGAATTIGVLLPVLTAPMAAVLPVVTTVLWFSRNYALGALTFLGMLPPIARMLGVPFYLSLYAMLVSYMVLATTYSRLSQLSWTVVRSSLLARIGDWRPTEAAGRFDHSIETALQTAILKSRREGVPA
jgi:glycerol-3-phosphate acyltransferase PlsY